MKIWIIVFFFWYPDGDPDHYQNFFSLFFCFHEIPTSSIDIVVMLTNRMTNRQINGHENNTSLVEVKIHIFVNTNKILSQVMPSTGREQYACFLIVFLSLFLPGTNSFLSPFRYYEWIQIYTAVANLLVILNSALNFLIFYMFGSKFRKLLRHLLYCRLYQTTFSSPIFRKRFATGGYQPGPQSACLCPPQQLS